MLPGEFISKATNKSKKFPLIKHWLAWEYSRYFSKMDNVNLFNGVYSTFEEALDNTPNTKVVGYDQPGPAQMYKGRAEQVHDTDYPVLFWFKSLLKRDLKVFDFGGHIGVSYYAYRKLLDFGEELVWTVCDVPAVVEEGRAFSEETGAKNLHFTTDFNLASGADVFLANGSLQYLERPLAEMLSEIKEKPAHVLVNMLPLHVKHEYVTVQNIGTAFCPYKIFQKEKFFDELSAEGYSLVDTWKNPAKACPIPFHEQYSVSGYSGAYFRR